MPNQMSLAASLLQELVGELLMQLGECQALPPQPPCEVAQQAEVLSHGRAGITQFREGSEERVQMRSERVTSVEFCGRTVWKGLFEHLSSPFLGDGMPHKGKDVRI